MRNSIYKEAVQVANIADRLQKQDPELTRIDAVTKAMKEFKKEKKVDN